MLAKARYYNPKISVWLSVDPLAHKYPSLSPYVFTGNNPIMLVDPDGRELWLGGDVSLALRDIYSFVGGKDVFDMYFKEVNGQIIQVRQIIHGAGKLDPGLMIISDLSTSSEIKVRHNAYGSNNGEITLGTRYSQSGKYRGEEKWSLSKKQVYNCSITAFDPLGEMDDVSYSFSPLEGSGFDGETHISDVSEFKNVDGSGKTRASIFFHEFSELYFRTYERKGTQKAKRGLPYIESHQKAINLEKGLPNNDIRRSVDSEGQGGKR